MENPVKYKLKNGIPTFGSWITLAHTAIAEIMAKSGFEWLAIDMEHSVIGIQDVEPIIQVIEASGCVPLIRLWDNDPVLAKRVMDAGAYGIIVPMVNSKKDAVKAVGSIKYPPEGERGVGLYRAQGFGVSFDVYKDSINRESLVIVQIEHKNAVDNIHDILSVKGVDGILIGPYDISGSYGVIGQLNHPLVIHAQEKVISAAKDANMPAGIHVVHPLLDDVRKRLSEGFTFIAYSTDAILLNNKCMESTLGLKQLTSELSQDTRLHK